MTTEEEAREAADEKEVQAEAMDLEPFNMQTRLDSKLSLMEIKNVGKTIYSTEGTLNIPKDQVLVEAPSEIKLHPEHNLNGTASSLNGHMNEENKISNEQQHEDNKKDHEQVKAAFDAENTGQNNKINKEVNDCSNHGEATTEDSSLLKHEKEEEPKGDDRQDQYPIQDTSKADSDVNQSQIVVDRLDHNLDLAKETEDTQPASMANIPHVEVVAEAHTGVQSPLDSDAIVDTIDGRTEKDESAREDDPIHLEHRESFPEDTSIAKHTEEVAKAEDQQSKQDGAMDADVVQEDIPKCEESGVSEETPKSEHADESTVDTQEVLHQEPSEETNGPAYEKKEQTFQQSSMAASDDTISEHDATTCETPVDIQVQNKESLQDSVETNTEISETHNVQIAPSSEEDKVENNVTARGPTSGGQEVDNAGSTEEIMENIAENIVLVSNVANIQPEVKKNIEPVEAEEDSVQRLVSLLDNSAQEDNTPVSEKQQMESALEIYETEATRTEAVPEESNASVSEEASPEDYVTESETTRDAKEVNTTESLEAIKGNKDTQTKEISNQSKMDSAGKSIQENKAPECKTTSDIQPEKEPESKEMKDTELVQVNETSPQINATIFHKQTQENNPTTSKLHFMESEGGKSNIEATEEQTTPHQLADHHLEEKATEEMITSSEPQTLESFEKINDIEANKPLSIPQQSIIAPSKESIPEEIAEEDIVTIEPDDGHQQPQDPELAELDEIKTNKSQEVASSSIVSNNEEPASSEDNVTVIESNPETRAENVQSAEAMEYTKNVKSHGALAGEAAQEENVETEASADISSVQEPELEEAQNTEPVGTDDNITSSDLPAERMEKETVEIEAIPHESAVTSITEVTENNVLTAIAPHAAIQTVLEQESVEDKYIATTEKPRETHPIVGSSSDELTPKEDNTTMTEPAYDTPLQNVIAQGIKDSEDAQTEKFSNLDSFLTPREATEESKLPRTEPTSDVPEVQELGSAEETRDIKATETENQQQHIVSTLEEPAVGNKPNVDDHHVHKEKPAELKDNEAMEAEKVLEKSNISTPDDATEEMSELRNDPDCCVQPAQQVESSRDNEDSKLLEAEETSDQKFITLEDTATEDIVLYEIDLPVGMEQEHESVEQFKDISANKAKQDLGISHGENITHVHDKDINGEPVTERGTVEASQALIENDTQASQDVMEKDDTIKSGEQTNDQRQLGDVEHRPQTCESSAEDEAAQMLEPGLASSVQEISDTASSEDHILENDPIDVPYNAESGEHEDKECTNKVNDDLLVIQSVKEIVDGTQENEQMQNEAKAVHAESQTKDEEEEMFQLHANEPYNLDIKMDDTAHGEEIIHDNTTVQPREIEAMRENKGLSSIYKPVVETSEQNNVEKDSSIHHKAEDEKLESIEDNPVELEATQQKVDTSNVDTNNDDQLPISSSLTKHETESADEILQPETEGNAFDKVDEYEKTEGSNTSVPETATFNEDICDKVTEAEGGLSDESHETFGDIRRNIDASSVVTAANEENMNEEMEEHKLAIPAHHTMDENTPKQEIFLSHKPLPTEPEEQEDAQTLKQQDDEDMHEPDFGDDPKEVEQDLPVSNFLMNLILGKENSDANEHSEAVVETKQEETRDDNSCLIIPKQEESLALPPPENNVEDKIAVEQEKKDAKCSEETHEVVEERSHDLKLGTETSLRTDSELNMNSHHLELPPYQDKMQDEFPNEVLSEAAAEEFTKIETKDVATPNINQDNGEVAPVCQENMEAATQIENGNLKNNLDDLNNTKASEEVNDTKASEEDTLGEGQTGLLPECLNDNRSVNAVSGQTLQFTESGIANAKNLPSEADSIQNPVCEIQDKTIEFSSIGATSIPDIQVESEEDKTDEKQPATTATGEVADEHVEISNDNPQKSIGPEVTSFEQEPQIAEKVSDTEIALGDEKEISEGSSSTFMDKKEYSDVSVKGVDNIQTAAEIQADDSNIHVNQEKQEASDNKTEMDSEKLEESNIQEQEGNGTEQKYGCHEEDQKFLAKKETMMKEADVHKTVKSHIETVNIKSNDEQELSDTKVQERDLNVFSPKDVREPEESFVDITKPEFSTDEEQSSKADELDMSQQKAYQRKIKGEEKIKSFTDEEMKIEAQAAGQKAAHKKQNLLSGVGSKVKHQLAKVKKAITGKPGRTKPESPK